MYSVEEICFYHRSGRVYANWTKVGEFVESVVSGTDHHLPLAWAKISPLFRLGWSRSWTRGRLPISELSLL